MNKVFLSGRLGKDPELRYTKSGMEACNFSLATSEYRKGANGESQEQTQWHNILVWGKQGAACAKYLKKGSEATIAGRIQTDSWEDKDGAKRFKVQIIADDVKFHGKPTETESEKPVPAAAQKSSATEFDFNADDVPF